MFGRCLFQPVDNHSAYSAAWLSPAAYFLKTSYANRATLEWHSHNLYQANEGAAYKIEEHEMFFVNHISEYEHHVARKQGGGLSKGLDQAGEATVARMADAEEERACRTPDRVLSKRHHETVGVM